MKEIRLCWRADVVHHEDEERHGGAWFPWTLENLATLVVIEEAGNEARHLTRGRSVSLGAVAPLRGGCPLRPASRGGSARGGRRALPAS